MLAPSIVAKEICFSNTKEFYYAFFRTEQTKKKTKTGRRKKFVKWPEHIHNVQRTHCRMGYANVDVVVIEIKHRNAVKRNNLLAAHCVAVHEIVKFFSFGCICEMCVCVFTGILHTKRTNRLYRNQSVSSIHFLRPAFLFLPSRETKTIGKKSHTRNMISVCVFALEQQTERTFYTT